ncbi:MAG: hypothetical protein ACREFE_01790 [Limisphaerales bacterium]
MSRFFVASLTTRGEPYNRTAIHAETDFICRESQSVTPDLTADAAGQSFPKELAATVRLQGVNSELLINASASGWFTLLAKR